MFERFTVSSHSSVGVTSASATATDYTKGTMMARRLGLLLTASLLACGCARQPRQQVSAHPSPAPTPRSATEEGNPAHEYFMSGDDLHRFVTEVKQKCGTGVWNSLRLMRAGQVEVVYASIPNFDTAQARVYGYVAFRDEQRTFRRDESRADKFASGRFAKEDVTFDADLLTAEMLRRIVESIPPLTDEPGDIRMVELKIYKWPRQPLEIRAVVATGEKTFFISYDEQGRAVRLFTEPKRERMPREEWGDESGFGGEGVTAKATTRQRSEEVIHGESRGD